MLGHKPVPLERGLSLRIGDLGPSPESAVVQTGALDGNLGLIFSFLIAKLVGFRTFRGWRSLVVQPPVENHVDQEGSSPSHCRFLEVPAQWRFLKPCCLCQLWMEVCMLSARGQAQSNGLWKKVIWIWSLGDMDMCSAASKKTFQKKRKTVICYLIKIMESRRG